MKTLRCKFLVLLALAIVSAGPVFADAPKKPFPDTQEPASPAELKALQDRVKKTLDKVLPCTVAVRIGATSGSGVIVSKEGHILTAGHVSGEPGREVVIHMNDGKRVTGKSLGANFGVDSGMIKITGEGDWPHLDMGKSADVKQGQWVLCIGHPGGYQKNRSAVVRLGRVHNNRANFIQTDCPMVGGDSGGPLFDLDGKVIGINSRIDVNITHNLHVPVDVYRETWDRLAKGEAWGGKTESFLGVRLDPRAKECRVTDVVEGSPAAKAGLRANDVITRFNGAPVDDADDLIRMVGRKKPGSKIALDIARGDDKLKLNVVVGKRED